MTAKVLIQQAQRENIKEENTHKFGLTVKIVGDKRKIQITINFLA